MAGVITNKIVAVLAQEQDLGWIGESLKETSVELTYAASVQEVMDTAEMVVLLDADAHDWHSAVDEIHQRKPEARVVLLSQHADGQMRKTVLEGGAYDLCAKPCQPRGFQSIILGALSS